MVDRRLSPKLERPDGGVPGSGVPDLGMLREFDLIEQLVVIYLLTMIYQLAWRGASRCRLSDERERGLCGRLLAWSGR